MKKDVYFDKKKNIYLKEEDFHDIKAFNAEDHSNEHRYYMHPLGVPVFLNKKQIDESDEYAHGDPYNVQKNIEGEFQQRRLSFTLELLGKVASQQSRVLDIGCGKGDLTCKLVDKVSPSNIFGFDSSLNAVINAKKNCPEIEFAVADAYTPPYPDNYFDVVLCNNLWEHVPDPLVLLRAIKSILKKHGYVIISTPSRYRIDNLMKVVKGMPVEFMSLHHVTEYSVGQVIEQLEFEKFKVTEIGSCPIKGKYKGIKSLVLHRVIQPVLQWYLNKKKSHTCLESTVFYLAQKT